MDCAELVSGIYNIRILINVILNEIKNDIKKISVKQDYYGLRTQQ
jgi:hypothetical protein